jgi:hypothetical protein
MLEALQSLAPNLDSLRVINTGASEIHRVFTGSDFNAVLQAYMVGIKDVFAFALAGSAAAVLLSFLIPFKKLPDHDAKKMEEKVVTA